MPAVGEVGGPSWRVSLKDEDELAWWAERRVLDTVGVVRIRAAAARLVDRATAGAWPFDADWDAWVPDARWGASRLPLGWDRVGV